MITEIPSLELPGWLSALNATSIEKGPFPLREILAGSLYYPASGLDPDPIAYLAGNFYSFVYVDHSITPVVLDKDLYEKPFKGYRILGRRSITQDELWANGWMPIRRRMPRYRPRPIFTIEAPFAEWFVFERHEDYGEKHGPLRFSFLFICDEGAMSFKALYHVSHVKPACVAIIQPGGGRDELFDLEAPTGILAQSVFANPAGSPSCLLFGGQGGKHFYGKTCWPEYSLFVCWLGNTSIGLWKRNGL